MNATFSLAAVAFGALTLASAEDVPMMLASILSQVTVVEPTTTLQLVLPIDVVELTKAVFTGIAAVGSAFAAVYSVVGAARAKRALAVAAAADNKIMTVSTQIDGLLAARDIAKVAEGEKKAEAVGARVAAALAKGQQQVNETGQVKASEGPLPVADDRTAGAAERVAEATERVAVATEEKK